MSKALTHPVWPGFNAAMNNALTPNRQPGNTLGMCMCQQPLAADSG